MNLSVCHIITGLKTGGAERMLGRLLAFSSKNQTVFSLTDCGSQGDAIKKLGISVYSLRLSFSLDLPLRLLIFIRLLWRLNPDVIVGWMYHGNLLASLGGVICKKPVFWNVRHSISDIGLEKPVMRAIVRIGAWLSHHPHCIIYNSHVAAEQHKSLGFAHRRKCVLPNGFDVNLYRPNIDARRTVRAELGLSGDTFLVGHVARYHPMKNHKGFLMSAAQLVQRLPETHFVMIGSGVTMENAELSEEIESLGLIDNIHLLGERSDIPMLMAAFDVQVSSSAWGEGFPNVIGEAMACGIPAVVTDIGGSRYVVGETGLVIPSEDTNALSDALERIYRMDKNERKLLGAKARKRAIDEFSLPLVAKRYMSVWGNDDLSVRKYF